MTASTRLSPGLAQRIKDAEAVFVSVVSAWEIEIKKNLGKLLAPDDLEATLAILNVRPLSVTLQDAIVAGRLPRHHRDPFDRMLIAQATLQSLTLVTSDAILKAYDVPVMLV